MIFRQCDPQLNSECPQSLRDAPSQVHDSEQCYRSYIKKEPKKTLIVGVRRLPKIIGLTGPSGAGKSTAAAMLADLGCAVIDGDALAREIVLPGSPVLSQLADRFGDDILCEGGTLDRKKLAERAFAGEKSRQDLNAITHPAITQLALTRINTLKNKSMVVLDAAALLESELAALCGHILIITAPEALRLQRIIARDGLTEAQARQRIAAQRQVQYQPPAGMGYTIINTTEGEVALRDAVQAFYHDICGDGAGGGAGVCVPGPDH